MPDLGNRNSYETQVKDAMAAVWNAAMRSVPMGLRAINAAIRKALQKFVRPVMERVYKRVMALLWLFLLDNRKTAGRAASRPWSTKQIEADARKEAKKHVDVLGRQMAKTNSDRWKSKPSDIPDEDWARDHMFNDDRADAVAVTEPTMATTIAERKVAEKATEAGIKLSPYWVTARDDRVCKICNPLDGKHEREWKRQFLAGPPAHPRCRCFLRWEPD